MHDLEAGEHDKKGKDGMPARYFSLNHHSGGGRYPR
jgi:hypothetical protein